MPVKYFNRAVFFFAFLFSSVTANAIELVDITDSLTINHESYGESDGIHFDEETGRIIKDTLLSITNNTSDPFGAPIRIYPTFFTNGAIDHRSVDAAFVDGYDENNSAPYYDLTSKTGANAIAPGETLQFRVKYLYDMYAYVDYFVKVKQVVTSNSAPVISSTPLQSALVGQQYQYDVQASDPDESDSLTFSLESGPSGMGFEEENRLSWIPASQQVGTHSVTISVADPAGLTATQTFDIEVIQANRAPEIVSLPIIQSYDDEAYSYQVIAIDPDDDDVAYSLLSGPAGMLMNQAGLIQWNPGMDSVGSHAVSIQAVDPQGLRDEQQYSLEILERNHAPVITSIAPTTAEVGSEYRYPVQATDDNSGDQLVYELLNSPADMAISDAGVITWTPTESGDAPVTLRVSDDESAYDEQSFNIETIQANRAPEIVSLPIIQNYDDEDYSYQVIAIDPDEDAVSYSLLSGPAGMLMNQEGLIQWQPGIDSVGTHTVSIHATDTQGLHDEQQYSLEILERNRVPVITSAAPTAAEVGFEYRYQVQATDENSDDVLVYELISAPSEMVMSEDGLVTWVPSESGDEPVTIRVSDDESAYDEQSFIISVEENNEAYSIRFTSEPTRIVQVGDTYSYQAVAITTSDTDITYSLSVGPLGMSIDQQAGLLRWDPAGEDVGSNPIIIKAFDEDGNVAEQAFTVQVEQGLVAPKIVSEPETSVVEGRGYEYLVDVDPDSGGYAYSLHSSSSQAAIDSNGRLRWQPEADIVNPLTTRNGSCSVAPADPGQFDPVLKWHWQGGQVRITPLVGQLSDDNGDGVINELDKPDVVFTAYNENDYSQAWLVVLDGETGSPLPTFDPPADRFHAYTHLALGDIDGDDVVEIVALTTDGYIVAYDETGGEPKWKKERPSRLGVRAAPALYDLNGDGEIEILISRFVFDSTGDLLWEGEGESSGGGMSCGCDHRIGDHGPNTDYLSFAADLIPSRFGLEVVVGNQVYSASGSLLWTAESTNDGFSAVGDLDGDGSPELVILDSASAEISVVNNRGKLVWDKRIEGSKGGPPTLSDINNDGKLEIGFASRSRYVVYSHAGEELWDIDASDHSSGITGSTVFDFEGDGKADIVYFDENELRVFDEAGGLKFSIENNSGTWIEYPVIVDLDNDNHADILIPSSDNERVNGDANITKGVRAFQDRYNTWQDTRSIWNQHPYHIDNINDNGTIPADPEIGYLTHNTFRLSSFPNRFGQERLDLTLANLQLETKDSEKSISVDVINRTDIFIRDQFMVRFYHGSPDQGDMIGQINVEGIEQYQTRNVRLSNIITDDWSGRIYAEIDYSAPTPECQVTNNLIVGTYFKVFVSDDRYRSDSQEFLVTVTNHNTAPYVTSTAESAVTVGNEYSYQVLGVDDDLGDALSYSLVVAPEGMTISSYDGTIKWSPTNQQAGSNRVVVGVIDSAGSLFKHDFTIEVIGNQEENLPPYITNHYCPIV